MVVGAVPHVLEDMGHVRKLGEAVPVRSLTAHLGAGQHRLTAEHGHHMTADAGGCDAAFGRAGARAVRASGTEVRCAHGVRHRHRRLRDPCREHRGPLRDLGPVGPDAAQPLRDHARQLDRLQLRVGRDHRLAVLIGLADDPGRPDSAIQQRLRLVLREGVLLLDEQQFRMPIREVAQLSAVQGVHTTELVEGDAAGARRRFIQPQQRQRLEHILERLAGRDDAQSAVGAGEHDTVQLVRPDEALQELPPVALQDEFRPLPIDERRMVVDSLRRQLVRLRQDRFRLLDAHPHDRRLLTDFVTELEADEQARVSRHGDPEQAQIEHVLDV